MKKSSTEAQEATDRVVAEKEAYYTAIRRKMKATDAGDADAAIEADREMREATARLAIAVNVQRRAKRDELERLRDEVPGRRENLRRALEQTTTDAVMHLEVACRLMHAAGYGSVEDAVRRAVAFSNEIPAVALGNGQAAADAHLEEHPVPDVAALREALHGLENALDGNPYAVESMAKRQVNRALREKLTPTQLSERADLDLWARRR